MVDVLGRTRASQMLLSQRITKGSCLLFEKHLRNPLGRHLLARSGLMSTLDEGQFQPAASRRRRDSALLSEAAPQEVRHRIFDLPVLLDRTDLHRTYQIIGQVERRLHEAIMPESWLLATSSGCRIPALSTSYLSAWHLHRTSSGHPRTWHLICSVAPHLLSTSSWGWGWAALEKGTRKWRAYSPPPLRIESELDLDGLLDPLDISLREPANPL